MVTKSKRGPLFRAPQQKLDQLSCCGHESEELEAWVETLPRANLGEMARLLYIVIQELNQLRVESAERFALLEIVRPAIYYLCHSLRKHYLNQTIVLPEKAAKVANLAQALQTHLATGYKIVVMNNVNRADHDGSRELLSSAIHRAISDMTGTLFRCYQLYFTAPSNLWSDINKLYGLAEDFKFTKDSLADEQATDGLSLTLQEVYLRTCVLSTIKPNQLRQSELALVYQVVPYLVNHVTLASNGSEGQPFVVNLLSGQEPVYRSIAKKIRNANNRYFECSALMLELNALRDSDETRKDVLVAKQFSSELILHLEGVWSGQKERTFDRTEHKGTLQVGLGMSVVHYNLAGSDGFEALLNSPDSSSSNSSFSAGSGLDLSASSLDAFSENPSAEPDKKTARYDVAQCRLVNTSPGGYCIELPNSVPGSIKTGELAIVREEGHFQWTLGVIRWAKRQSKKSVRIGLELMASQTKPVGVKVLHKMGDMGSYMRGMLLPELKALEQPMSVLVPNVSFHEGMKVLVNEGGRETKLKLKTMISKTASFSQFEIELLTPNHALGMFDQQAEIDAHKNDDFDAIWSSL